MQQQLAQVGVFPGAGEIKGAGGKKLPEQDAARAGGFFKVFRQTLSRNRQKDSSVATIPPDRLFTTGLLQQPRFEEEEETEQKLQVLFPQVEETAVNVWPGGLLGDNSDREPAITEENERQPEATTQYHVVNPVGITGEYRRQPEEKARFYSPSANGRGTAGAHERQPGETAFPFSRFAKIEAAGTEEPREVTPARAETAVPVTAHRERIATGEDRAGAPAAGRQEPSPAFFHVPPLDAEGKATARLHPTGDFRKAAVFSGDGSPVLRPGGGRAADQPRQEPENSPRLPAEIEAGRREPGEKLSALFAGASPGVSAPAGVSSGVSALKREGTLPAEKKMVDLVEKTARACARDPLAGTSQLSVDKAPEERETGTTGPVERFLEQEKIMGQILQGARFMVKNGATRLHLQLEPPELGRLELAMVIDRNMVAARFTAESQVVQALIEANLPELRSSLQEAGLQVDHLQAEVQTGADSQGSSSGEMLHENTFAAPAGPDISSTISGEPEQEDREQAWLGRINILI